MRPRIEIGGQRFGRLTIGAYVGDGKWSAVCDCGRTKVVKGNHLRTDLVRSCGCIRRDTAKASAATVAERTTWNGMISRCYRPNTTGFADYGGRGIVVCDRWRESFEAFLAYMGPRPSPAHSIDRIDVDGNYEPGNCRWATAVEQRRNTRASVFVEHDGRRMCVGQWAAELGLAPQLLRWRLARGWPLEKALSASRHGRGGKKAA